MTPPVSPVSHLARERLLHTALRLFAKRGYTKTSVREIAEAAQTNIASISYYFGDKAGLYRAAFLEPNGCEVTPELLPPPEASARTVLAFFIEAFIAPLRQGEMAELSMKLRLREMLEPTGLWQEEIDQGIRPMHDALVARIVQWAQVPEATQDIHALAISIGALGVHLHVGRDVMNAIDRRLTAHDAWDGWRDRFVNYACAMIQAEFPSAKLD